MGDVGIDHAGLHHHACVRDIQFEDAVQAGEADHNAAFDREGAAAESGTGAARDERNVLLSAEPDYALNLLSCRRQDNGKRHNAKVGQAVTFISTQLLTRGNQALADN